MYAGLTLRNLKYRSGVYGGKLRFLLAADLRQQIPPVVPASTKKLLNTDIEAQQHLMEKGYIGFQLERIPGEKDHFWIHYGKTN